MCGFTPKISCNNSKPGPRPAGGKARYAPKRPAALSTSIHWVVMALM